VSDLKLAIHIYQASRQSILDEFAADPDGELGNDGVSRLS
jgi:hypothetical protein